MQFPELLRTTTQPSRLLALYGILILFLLSILSLLFAPGLMPASYNWVAHTTSESAAQGVKGAWLARLGFIFYGLAVLWLSVALRGTWCRGAIIFHACFGAFMLSTAAFSSRAWMPVMEYDRIEDWLHSFTSTAMGFAFVLGVLAVFFQRMRHAYAQKSMDFIAVAVATLMPIGLGIWPDYSGLIQRLMFTVAYAWYAKEAYELKSMK